LGKRRQKRETLKLFGSFEKLFLILLSFIVYYLHTTNGPLYEPKKEIKKAPLLSRKNFRIKSNSFSFKGGWIYFDEKISEKMLSLIKKAKKSIKISSYTFGAKKIEAALIAAHKRDVDVQLVYGKYYGKKRSYPFESTLFRPDKGIMHEKFLIIDGKESFVSSANFTSGNSKNSAIHFISAPRLTAILEDEFNLLKKKKISKKCRKGCEFNYGTLYFSPGKSCINVKKVLKNSENSIKLAIYTITLKTPLIAGLKKALKNGTKVTAIMDDWNFPGEKDINRRAYRYLASLGADVRLDKIYDKKRKLILHHKFAVVDDKKVIFGSMNWTKSGCYKNRELTIISSNPGIANGFSKYFDELAENISSLNPQDN